MDIECRNAKRIARDLNNALDDLTHSESGSTVPLVCLCCDMLLLGEPTKWMKRTTLRDRIDIFRDALETCYATEEVDAATQRAFANYYKTVHSDVIPWLDDMHISPKTVCDSGSDSFLLCKPCHSALQRHKYPCYGICNGWLFGTPPPQLMVLKDVELSCMSLVRNMAHIWSSNGMARSVELFGLSDLGITIMSPWWWGWCSAANVASPVCSATL